MENPLNRMFGANEKRAKDFKEQMADAVRAGDGFEMAGLFIDKYNPMRPEDFEHGAVMFANVLKEISGRLSSEELKAGGGNPFFMHTSKPDMTPQEAWARRQAEVVRMQITGSDPVRENIFDKALNDVFAEA